MSELDTPPPSDTASTARQESSPEPPETAGGPAAPAPRIGPYSLRQKLGEGGMGEVWAAEQEEPVRRGVALKLIRRGMGSKEVLARFDSERQALAFLSHPSIAAIYDAGVTESGRPYFAMELVKGESITTYCDRHRLRASERLELFCQVCDAVQHAHQKGIIHRDLKPSNVLVTVQGDRPLPKIIDFGVAKATARRLTERTVFTEYGQLIGTPEYMSPEQAEMTGLDIDTRTDVYSLGALLYELLAGVPPFQFEARSAGFAEIQRRIREEDPPRPSARLTQLGEKATTVAVQRHADSAALVKHLRGDLDWIVMKALEKDRTRRYASANGLAMDVQRHLRHEPVVAGPPSTAYRMAKFIRRHRLGVTAAALVTLALVAGTVGTAIGLVRAREAERRLRTEAETARQISDFMVELFEVSDPSEARGNEITAREILDRGADRIESQLTGQPAIEARLLRTVGRVYRALGLYQPAEPLLEKAVELSETALGPGRHDLARSLDELGVDKMDLGKLDEAEALFQRALQIWRSSPDPAEADEARTLLNLAAVFRLQGKLGEAEDVLARLLPLEEQRLGPEDLELARTLESLAQTHHDQGDYPAFEEVTQRVLEIRQGALEPAHPVLATSFHSLGDARMHTGKLKESEAAFARALAIREQVLGLKHSDTIGSMYMLANVIDSQNRLDEAQSLMERVVSIAEETLGSDHLYVATILAGLGDLHSRRGNLVEAARLTERALAILERSQGPDSVRLALVLNNLAEIHLALDRPAEAEVLIRRAMEAETNAGPNHPEVLRSVTLQAHLHRERREFAAARPLYERAVRGFGEHAEDSTDRNSTLGQALDGLGFLAREEGREEEALELFQRAADILCVAPELRADTSLESRRACASVLRELGRVEEAAELVTEG